MKVISNQIVELQPGVYLKSSEFEKNRKAFFVGLKDFDEKFSFIGDAPRINPKKVKEKYFIAPEDVLFSTRVKFNAFKLPKNTNMQFVASNSFVILKPLLQKILPEYLHWYLNHYKTQESLQRMIYGQTSLPFISVKQLGDLEIALPNIETQKTIVKLHQLQKKEKQLTEKIINKKELYNQTLLL